MVKLFGGNIICGNGLFAALERICLSYNLFDEPNRSNVLFTQEFMVNFDFEAFDKRVWFETSYGPFWISLDPAQTLLEHPSEPCHIVKCPTGSPDPSWLEILDAAIDACNDFGPSDIGEEDVLRAAQRLRQHGSGTVSNDFREAIRKIQPGLPREQLNKLIENLFTRFIDESPCSIFNFSSILVTIIIQASTGFYIEEDWTEQPRRFVQVYLRHILKESHLRYDAIEAMRSATRQTHDAGRTAVEMSLKGTFAQQTRHLRRGAIYHCAAYLMNSALADSEVGDLPVHPPIIAEEGWVCTQTGIDLGARFCLEEFGKEAIRLLTDAHGNPKRLMSSALGSSSAIQPKFPNFFARVLAAHALTFASGKEKFLLGINHLEKLRTRVPSGGQFESDWIDLALMKAYKKIGDENAARLKAAALAAKVMVARGLLEDQ